MGKDSLDTSLGALVGRLSTINTCLWHEEDMARSDNDHQVVVAKRKIDKLNQERNEIIENIDELILDKVGIDGNNR